MGKTTLSIVPTVSGVAPLQLEVEVLAPTRLGTSQTTYDTYLINVAHNVGIPPQYLKGQARQEAYRGILAEDNYRYEPCGADLRNVSGGARYAYNDPDFIAFRLDDHIGITLHPGVQDELDPRSRFFVVRNACDGTPPAVDRRIDDCDRNVTAQEIWDNNNDLRAPGHVRYNFDTGCRRSDLEAIADDALDFVAQTPTAQSSGIFQTMWDEARNAAYWNGVTTDGRTGVREPKYIFDRAMYVNVGGGSVSIGARR